MYQIIVHVFDKYGSDQPSMSWWLEWGSSSEVVYWYENASLSVYGVTQVVSWSNGCSGVQIDCFRETELPSSYGMYYICYGMSMWFMDDFCIISADSGKPRLVA
jgi:hypothetical protein